MERLRAIALSRGFFTRDEAYAVGFDSYAITRHVRLGVWRKVRAGAYTFTDLWPDDPASQHLVTARAAITKLDGRAVASHTTGALAHGLRLWRPQLDTVHLTRVGPSAARLESGVRHHVGRLGPGDVTEAGSLPVVLAVRAAIEVAAMHGTEAGMVVLDSLLHLGKASREELDAAYEVMRQWPGMLAAGQAVRLAAPGGQSVGESRSRFVFWRQGVPAPELQWPIANEHGEIVAVTDFAWPDYRLIGEFDGRVKYGRLLRAGETPADAVFREKQREDMIRDLTGWTVVRFAWDELYQPRAMAGRVLTRMRRPA